MISVETETNLTGNIFRRRYRVVLIDLLGNEHVDIIGIFNHSSENDGLEVEAQHLADKKEREIQAYKDKIVEGKNPFISASLWNTRQELLKYVLDDALSLPVTNPIVYNGLPYISRVSDIELMALYNKDQPWVDNIRLKTSELLSAKSILDNYEAML